MGPFQTAAAAAGGGGLLASRSLCFVGAVLLFSGASAASHFCRLASFIGPLPPFE
jgi:hypothetical protein